MTATAKLRHGLLDSLQEHKGLRQTTALFVKNGEIAGGAAFMPCVSGMFSNTRCCFRRRGQHNGLRKLLVSGLG
jgi:hypothetical protein